MGWDLICPHSPFEPCENSSPPKTRILEGMAEL